MNHDVVPRLDQNIVESLTRQRVAQRDIEDFLRTVGHRAKELRLVEPGFWRGPAGLVHRIAEMLLAARPVAPRGFHFPADQHFWYRFEIVPAKDSDGIEWLKLRSIFRMREGCRQVESKNYRAVVRRGDANDFGVAPRGLRQQILVRGDDIREFDSLTIGV